MEPDVLTEVPATLKRLVRYVVRGFYNIEHAIVVDLLIHHPCVKEDDMLELLKFERKQLRATINTLKNDKFIKSRMRVETDAEGKMTKHNFYFINYSVFVNVVKYKLDHMRRKIETEQRDIANRASYKCPQCQNTYTDLEADQLLDMMSGLFLCTYCKSEVEEQHVSEARTDSKSLMVKFNEQLQPLFGLLKEVEDVKLAACILEPEPIDIKTLRPHGGPANKSAPGEHTKWSGDASRNLGYGFTENQVTVNMDEKANMAEDKRQQKERPVWMTTSTIEGSVSEDMGTLGGSTSAEKSALSMDTSSKHNNEDIMKTLLAHERKSANTASASAKFAGLGDSDDGETSSSDSEDESRPEATAALAAAGLIMQPSVAQSSSSTTAVMMESDDDDDSVPMVTVLGQQVPYDQVTPDMVAQMTPTEKDAYIKLGQEMYEDIYD